MTYVPERATVSQKIQVGAESNSALGVVVAATKILQCFDFTVTPTMDVAYYRATGRKYDSTQEQNTEYSEVAVGGNLDYNGVIYPLGGIMGAASPTSHGSSSVAKDWVYTPPVTGTIVPQTYTLEQGDTSTRAHRLAYGLFTEFAYKGTRKDFTCSGKMLGYNIADGITMTSSPVAVALAPVVAKQVNVYLDSSSANLGTTLMNRLLSIDYSMTGVYDALWVLNRSTASWTSHVDLAPKCLLKLKVEANAEGMAILPYVQQGTTYWVRVNAQGVVIDNNQTLTISGVPTGGTFTITYKGQTTSALAYNATAATVQTAFLALSTVGAGNATISGSAGGPYTIAFSGTLATDTTAITASGASLTGGSSPAATPTQTQIYNTFTHDMAVKFGKPSAFADDQGVFAIEWEATIVEDATWTKSQTLTVTNLITAL